MVTPSIAPIRCRSECQSGMVGKASFWKVGLFACQYGSNSKVSDAGDAKKQYIYIYIIVILCVRICIDICNYIYMYVNLLYIYICIFMFFKYICMEHSAVGEIL